MSPVASFVAPIEHFEATPADIPADPRFPAGFALLTLHEIDPFLVYRGERLFPVWAELLTELENTETPVYVEAESDSRHVIRILLPRPERIVRIAESAEDGLLIVNTLSSNQDLWFRRDFDALRQKLEWAVGASDRELLLTTDPDTEEILDASPFELPDAGGPDGPQAPLPGRAILSERELDIAFVSLLRCRIPFDYLRDGCATRAHEMFRLLSLQGIQCDKVWLYALPVLPGQPASKLCLRTPAGDVSWNFHVAPRVQVQLAGGLQVERVLDPSTFLRPVPEAEWAELLGRKSNLTLVPQQSSPEVYGRLINGLGTLEFDNNFVKTAAHLRVYRYLRALLLAPRFIPWG